MQPRVIVAEQTSRNRYAQPGSMPPREIEMTIRLMVPEDEGADVGISAEFVPGVPEQWEDGLSQRLYRGVHGGLARVGSPLPAGGIEVRISKVRVFPQLSTDSDQDDVRRVGETLEALTAATVSALWSGLIHLGSLSAA